MPDPDPDPDPDYLDDELDLRRQDQRLTWLVHHAARANEGLVREALRPVGLTIVQFLVLHDLAVGPERPPTDLAFASGVTRQSMHATIRRLEALGLVRRHRTFDGRGAYVVQITDAGSDAFQRADRTIVSFERMLTQPFGDERRMPFLHLLRSYIRSIERLRGRPSAAAWEWDA